MLQDLQDQEALFRFHNFGQFVALHLEDAILEFLGEFSTLVDAEEAALAFGAAVGKTLGDFAEVFAVLYALQRGLSLFLQVRELFRFLPFRADHDFPQSDLLGAHEFRLVRFVILRHFIVGDVDVRTDFTANHTLRQRIEPLDQLRLYAHAHVLGALHKKGLVDQFTQRVFLAIFNVGLQLFRRAAILAFRLGILCGGLARFVVLRSRDDFIVDARNDLFDGLPAFRIGCFRNGGFCRLFGFGVGRRHSWLLKSGPRRWFRLGALRLVLCRERQSHAEARNDD